MNEVDATENSRSTLDNSKRQINPSFDASISPRSGEIAPGKPSKSEMEISEEN